MTEVRPSRASLAPTGSAFNLWEQSLLAMLLVLEHYMPNHGVTLQPVHRHVLPVTGQFLTAMGIFADEHEVRVHRGAAVLQARQKAMNLSDQ